jgi:hypothetical protein
MKLYARFSLLTALTFAPVVWAQEWSGFYARETLIYWHSQMPPGIEENLQQVIWPKLTPPEKPALAGVTLDFPLEDSHHPMNFYALDDGQVKTVTLPISSLRFFGDLALAYAWLNANGYSLDTVTDYLAMIKYQWPDGLVGTAYRPLEALRIPESARNDPAVMNAFQRTFASAVVFILAHELGHLYHQHATAVDPEDSQRQEEEADAFALEIMRRIGEAPVGMTFFFTLLAHLEPYAGDTDYAQRRAQATHPVTAARLRAIASGLTDQAESFSRTGTATAIITSIASDIEVIANNLDDAGVQNLFRKKGLTAKPEQLAPRKPGEHISTAQQEPHETGAAFSGIYTGQWIDAKGTALDVDMTLNRTGNQVTGSYSFGAGDVSLSAATLVGDQLHYNWTWGTEHFGKGVLNVDPTGQRLSGTWGYTDSETGGGRWELHRRAD